jgi:uncharacterized protein YbjT (DUF2867 family)
MILVIGGRSKIGSALIEELITRGQTVRALVRSPESAMGLPGQAEPVVGDLGDRASLAAAMKGADRVFVLSSPAQAEVEWHANAIDAARISGTRLLVRSSILGADPASKATFVADHGRSDAYLRASGVPYVILRPNAFLQNVPENTMPSIDTGGTFYANAGDARISMVDARDVAAVAAVVLTTAGHEGRAYDVTGPEALSYADIAGKLSRSMGRPVRFVDVPDEAVKTALLGFGLGEWLVGGLVDLYQDYKRSGVAGYAAAISDTVPRLTGRTGRSLDQLLGELH